MKKTNVRVDFRIMGDEFDINLITESLDILPSDSWKIGDEIRKTGKKRAYTAWIYSTGYEETLDINTQIKKIESLFLTRTDTLCDLKKQYNLDFSIDIVIVIEDKEPPAIYLDHSIINFAAGINARFDFDTYVN